MFPTIPHQVNNAMIAMINTIAISIPITIFWAIFISPPKRVEFIMIVSDVNNFVKQHVMVQRWLASSSF